MSRTVTHGARPSVKAHLLLTMVTLVWGCTFPLVKAALREVSPLFFNVLRMGLASFVLLLINGSGLRGLTRKQWSLCALAGLFLALGYDLQTAGLAYTTPTTSAFLTGLVVVLVPFFSMVPGFRAPGTPRPRATAYAGAILALFGIVLLTGNSVRPAALLSGLHRGEWLTLACAIAFAVHLLTLAHGAVVPARVLGTLQILFATAVMVAFLPLERPHRLHLTVAVAGALLVTAVFATAAAFTIQSWAQQHLPASHTALILTLEPVFAALFSLLFLHERLGIRAIGGACLILIGIILAELGPTVLGKAAILPVEP